MTPVYYSGGSRPSDKGGGGGGHPDPEIRGEVGLKKNSFSALRASAWSKNKGEGPHGPLPWIRHCIITSGWNSPFGFFVCYKIGCDELCQISTKALNFAQNSGQHSRQLS